MNVVQFLHAPDEVVAAIRKEVMAVAGEQEIEASMALRSACRTGYVNRDRDSAGRGLGQARIWTRDGKLAISVIQEGVVRVPRS